MKNNHLEDQPASLLNFYEAWMEDFQRLVAGGLRSENTLRKHKVIYKQLSRFLRESMKTEDIHLTDAGPSFIVDFHLFLKQNCHLAHNTIWNYLTPLQMLLRRAHQKGIIDTYPFADYHNRMKDTERCFLTQEELDRLTAFPSTITASGHGCATSLCFVATRGWRMSTCGGCAKRTSCATLLTTRYGYTLTERRQERRSMSSCCP